MPADPLKHALPLRLLTPTVRAIIAIPVAYDRQATVIIALDDEIDPLTRRADLRTGAIAAIEKPAEQHALYI
jgi:hypothetical protein